MELDMIELATLPNTSTADQVTAVILRDGGAIVEDFLSAETLCCLQGDLYPLLAATPCGRDETFAGARTRRLSRIFARTRRAVDVVTHPLFMGPATRILQEPVEIWSGDERVAISPDLHIGGAQAIQIGPGQGAQPLHRDDTVFLWRHPTFGREARLQIMVALSDFTAENGATLVIPGSHRWDDDRKPDRSEAIPAVMKAGSALMFLGSTYHGGGQNRTADQVRTGLTLGLDL
jgi:ectoine hydroxylase-related dioxygenase (phytanoyl-CoA dioxygenase family)